MSLSSKLLTILALLSSFAAGGCSLIEKWSTPQVWAKPGQVVEIRDRVVIPVVVKSEGKLKRAHLIAQPGWLVGPAPISEVK